MMRVIPFFILLTFSLGGAGCKSIHSSDATVNAVNPSGTFYRQGLPFALFEGKPGYFTAVTADDVNADGRQDLLFAGGRHTLQGRGWILLQGENTDGIPVFRESFSFGSPGGYTGIGVATAGDHGQDPFTLLLAGGSCHSCSGNNCYNGDRTCTNGKNTPAQLFQGQFESGKLTTSPLWKESQAGGNRTGLLARLGRDTDPSILLAGEDGFDLYQKGASGYAKAYHVDPPTSAGRFAGLAVKSWGGDPAQRLIVMGGRKSNPSVLALYGGSDQSAPARIEIQKIASKNFEVAGVALESLVSPDSLDVLVANGAGGTRQVSYVYSLQKLPNGALAVARSNPIDKVRLNARVITTGRFFADSTLPDIAIGTTTGEIRLYANQSRDGSLSLLYRTTLRLRTRNEGFEIRGLATVRLSSGLDALVAAVYNPGLSERGKACQVILDPKPEKADAYLANWPCHNAFILYPNL